VSVLNYYIGLRRRHRPCSRRCSLQLLSSTTSDIGKLARGIAARTEPRFIEIKPEPKRGVGRVLFTEAELTARRGGLTVEEYRLNFIRKWGA
jgi:hypothetical protein